MKTRKISITAVLLAILLLFAGCTHDGQTRRTEKDAQNSISLYFGNKDCTDLTEEKMSAKDIEPNKLPELVMEKLLDGPTKPENKRIIRAGTSLLHMTSERGAVTVNLSKEFYNEENILDVLASASIVKSLCSIRGVTTVTILVEGTELILDDGTAVSGMRDGDLVFEADALMQDEANITLYFCNEDADGLAREIRRVKISKGETIEQTIVSELIEGPQKEKLYKTLPSETKIRSVETKDGVCFVNLSNEFITKHSGGTAAEQLTVYSIVNSLTVLSHIDRVQFLIEGEKKDVFIHMVFNEPIVRDVSMVKN